MGAVPSAVSDRRSQRREDILARATELFARDGYADLDLQVLADSLGIGKGTLYRHFGSKQDLFLDRKSTRLNSSHTVISYAVFCLKKKKTKQKHISTQNKTIKAYHE